MTTWTPFTLAVVMNGLPTDLEAQRANWVSAHPEKANRLAEIVEETRKAIRDAVGSNPANVMDTGTDTVPNAGLRHGVNLAIFGLAMEMGVSLGANANDVVTRADIWLRMVANGAIPIACDAELRGGTPRYTTPQDREARPARVLVEGMA